MTLYPIVKYESKAINNLSIERHLEVFGMKYKLYKQKSTMKIYKNMRVTDTIQKYTIEYFFNERVEQYKVPQSIIKKLIGDLKMFQHYDFVVEIDQELFAYHTYRLLVFIYDALFAYKLSTNKTYLASTVSKNKPTTVDHYTKNFKLHLENSKNPSLIDNKDEIIKTKVNYSFMSQERIAKFITGMLSIFPITQYKFSEDEIEYKEKLIKLCNYISASKPTKKQIAISLAIVINFYMRFKMIKPTDKPIKDIDTKTKYILDTCFNESCGYKSSQLLNNIYIADNINFIPIFAVEARDKDNYSDGQIDFIYSLIRNERYKMKIPIDLPENISKEFIKNPVKLYLLKTPSKMIEEI